MEPQMHADERGRMGPVPVVGGEVRVLVVGPGAVGCLFASALIRAGIDTILLDHDEQRAHALGTQGLQVEMPNGDCRLPARATCDATSVGPVDMTLLCVKTFDTQAAIAHALPALEHSRIVASLQNGVGNLEALGERMDARRIVAAVTAQGSTQIGVGHVRHAGEGITRVAPFRSEGIARAQRVQALFLAAGFQTETVANVDTLLWSKLVVNAAVNPVTALWELTNGGVLEQPDARDTAYAAAREAERVVRAAGIDLLFDNACEEVDRVCTVTRDNVSSMLQDIRRGRRTEIDAINGAVVERAGTLGIDTPVNRELIDRIRALEGASG